MQELQDGGVSADMEERKAKIARQREYARILELQSAQQLQQKKISDADGRGTSVHVRGASNPSPAPEIYDPFGKGGAGAPLKNAAGSVVTAYGASRVDAVRDQDAELRRIRRQMEAAAADARAGAASEDLDPDAEIARLQALIRDKQRGGAAPAIGGNRAPPRMVEDDGFGPSPLPPQLLKARGGHPMQEQYLAEMAANNLSPSHAERRAKQQKVARKPGAPPTPDLYGPGAGAALPGNSPNKRGGYMAGVKELYGANLSEEEQRAKIERQRQYQSDLDMQTRALQDRKGRDRDEKRARDEREAAQARDYNPFGRGGAGAPLRNSDGSAVTNLKQHGRIQADQQNIYASQMPERMQDRIPDRDRDLGGYGGGGGGGGVINSQPGVAPSGQPFMSAMNELRGGPTSDEIMAKRARQAEYARSLEEQKRAQADKSVVHPTAAPHRAPMIFRAHPTCAVVCLCVCCD